MTITITEINGCKNCWNHPGIYYRPDGQDGCVKEICGCVMEQEERLTFFCSECQSDHGEGDDLFIIHRVYEFL